MRGRGKVGGDPPRLLLQLDDGDDGTQSHGRRQHSTGTEPVRETNRPFRAGNPETGSIGPSTAPDAPAD